jgi:hypothetical protein
VDLRALLFALASVAMGFEAGCATRPVVTEQTSKAIADVRAKCLARPDCTAGPVEDHGKSWWITVYAKLPPNTVGGDSVTYVVDKNLDHVTNMIVTQ